MRRPLLLVTTTLVLAVSVLGCSGGPADAPAESGISGEASPEPGRTIAATPDVEASAVIASGATIAVVWVSSPSSATLVTALEDIAAQAGARVAPFPAQSGADVDGAFAAAIDTRPDLVVGVGADIVDAFSFESPQLLSQQFLVLGAQLAEPTANVTAVVWDGATSRGSAASADGPLDEAAPTPQLATEAAMAGLTSIRDGVTGVVVELSPSR